MQFLSGSASNSRVMVLIRIRPPSSRKHDQANASNTAPYDIQIDQTDPRIITIQDPDRPHLAEREFMFDQIMNSSATQESVFEACKYLVENVLLGYNSCCFAYGQTGSGKTYSMFGEHGSLEGPLRGVIPRCMEMLFNLVDKRKNTVDVQLCVSFLEIYMGKVFDLGKVYLEDRNTADEGGKHRRRSRSINLALQTLHHPVNKAWQNSSTNATSARGHTPDFPQSKPATSRSRTNSPTARSRSALSNRSDNLPYAALEVRESSEGAVFVQDLEVIPITHIDEVMQIISAGVQRRATYETQMNEYSSRSHTVFTITVVQTDKRTNEVLSSKLNLVDLAGSERTKKNESEGQRLKEATVVNKSLSALGNVILGLERGDPYIPYRDSKVTRILQDSLGGNSFTILLATLNPAPENYEECVATLQFANRCKNVTNHPRVNYMDIGEQQQEKRVQKLQSEVASLKEEMSTMQAHYESKIAHLAEHLRLSGVDSTFLDYGQIDGNSSTRAASSQEIFERNYSQEQYKRQEQTRKDRESMAQKFEKQKQTFRSVYQTLKAEQQAHQHTMLQHKEQFQKISSEFDETKKHLLRTLRTTEEIHKGEVQRIIGQSELIFDQMNALIRSIPEAFRTNSVQLQAQQDLIAQVKRETEEYYRNLMTQLDSSQEQSTAEMRIMYEAIIDKHAKAAQESAQQLHQLKKETNAKCHEYEQELSLLFDYACKLSIIVSKLESGVYPVKLRWGIKGVQISEQDKPSALNLEFLPLLKKRLSRLDRFIATAEDCSASRQQHITSSVASAWVSSEAVTDETSQRPVHQGLQLNLGQIRTQPLPVKQQFQVVVPRICVSSSEQSDLSERQPASSARVLTRSLYSNRSDISHSTIVSDSSCSTNFSHAPVASSPTLSRPASAPTHRMPSTRTTSTTSTASSMKSQTQTNTTTSPASLNTGGTATTTVPLVYLQELEAYRDHYRQLHQADAKRFKDLQIAHEAARREIERLRAAVPKSKS